MLLAPGKRKVLPDRKTGWLRQQLEKLKIRIQGKVDHPFYVVKNIFGYKKAHYHGLTKNTAQLHTLFGLADLMIAKRGCSSFRPKVPPGMARITETANFVTMQTSNRIRAAFKSVRFVLLIAKPLIPIFEPNNR